MKVGDEPFNAKILDLLDDGKAVLRQLNHKNQFIVPIEQLSECAMQESFGEILRDSTLIGKEYDVSEYLPEMAKMCDKRDGFGFYIYVFGSDDPVHGRPEHLPIHAHVLAELRPAVLLGKIDMSNENTPSTHHDVKDADKDKLLSTDVKRKIVEWAKQKDDEFPSYNKWQTARFVFKKLNPHLFNN